MRLNFALYHFQIVLSFKNVAFSIDVVESLVAVHRRHQFFKRAVLFLLVSKWIENRVLQELKRRRPEEWVNLDKRLEDLHKLLVLISELYLEIERVIVLA